MRILVENSGYHLLNLGDVAMLQAACSRIEKLVPNAEIFVITSAPERLKIFCPNAIPVNNRYTMRWKNMKVLPIPKRMLWPGLRSATIRLESALKYNFPRLARVGIGVSAFLFQFSTKEIKEWIALLKSMDLVVATGGGFFTDAFVVHASYVCQTLRLAQAYRIPTVLLGQAIGPLNNATLVAKLRKIIACSSFISLREKVTGLVLLKQWKIAESKIKVTGDDALELVNTIDFATEKRVHKIGINLRVTDYSEIPKAAIDRLRKYLATLAQEEAASYVPLPIDLTSDTADQESIESIVKESGALDSLEIPQTPSDIIKRISQCRIVMTGSYHAALFSLAQGVPVIGFTASAYYNAKFQGLNDLFEGGIQMVNLKSKQLETDLQNSISKALCFNNEARKRWIESADKQKKQGCDAYAAIFKDCGSAM